MKMIFAILLVFSASAHAEHAPIIQQLMDEPASMFALGMMRLDQRVKQGKDNVFWTPEKPRLSPGSFDLYADYFPRDNKIIVKFWAMDSDATQDQMLENCERELKQLRNVVGKSIPQIFQTDATHGPESTKAMREQLLALIEFHCTVGESHSTSLRFKATQDFFTDELTVWEVDGQ